MNLKLTENKKIWLKDINGNLLEDNPFVYKFILRLVHFGNQGKELETHTLPPMGPRRCHRFELGPADWPAHQPFGEQRV